MEIEEVVETKEEVVQKTIKTYKTPDGKIFKTRKEAQNHLVLPFRNEIREDLQKIFIKLDNKGKDLEYSLLNLKSLIKAIIQEDDLDYDSTDYYNSNCY